MSSPVLEYLTQMIGSGLGNLAAYLAEEAAAIVDELTGENHA